MSAPLPDIPDDIVEAYFESDKYILPAFTPVQDQNQLHLQNIDTSYNQSLAHHQLQKSRHQNYQNNLHHHYVQSLQNNQLLESNSINTFVNDVAAADLGCNPIESSIERISRNDAVQNDDSFGLFPMTSPNFAFNLFNSGFSPLPAELEINPQSAPIQIPLSSAMFGPVPFPNNQRMDQIQFLSMLDNSFGYDFSGAGGGALDHNISRGLLYENHPPAPDLTIPITRTVPYPQMPLSIIKDEMSSLMEQTDISPTTDLSLCQDDTATKLSSLPPLSWEETNMGPYKPLVLKKGVNLVMEMRRVLRPPDELKENPLVTPITNIELTPSPSSSTSPSPSSSRSSSSLQCTQKKNLFRSQLSTSSSRALDRNVAELHKQQLSNNSLKAMFGTTANKSIDTSDLNGLKPSLNKCFIGSGSSSVNGSESSTASSNGSPVTIPIGAVGSLNSSQVGGKQLIEESISLIQEAISLSDGNENQTWVDDYIFRGNSPVNKSGIEKQRESIRINPRLDYQIREIIQRWTPYKPRSDRFFRIMDKNGTSFNVEELKEMLEIITSRPPRRINYYPAYQLCTDGEIGHGQTVTDWRHISTLHPSSSRTRQHIANPPACEPDMDENRRPVANLRKREGNIYEPTWVRGKKKLKEGWCDHCEGGFHLMKNSGYLYHKNHEHGIFPNGYIFEDPLLIRRKLERESKWEGLCGICYHWIDLDHTERKCWGTWYRHYKQCANEYEEFKKVLAASGAPVHLVELRYCPSEENLGNNN